MILNLAFVPEDFIVHELKKICFYIKSIGMDVLPLKFLEYFHLTTLEFMINNKN
jgi:hypothetical protein